MKKFRVSEFIALAGFTSVLVFTWLLIFGVVHVDAWLAVGAMTLFIVLGLGGALASNMPEKPPQT